MPVAPSFQDLVAQGQAEASSRRPDLVFAEGDVTLAQLHAAGAMADAVIRFAAQAFKDTFIDGASGDALTALVDDHLNIQRKEATPAQATARFTRTSGGAGGTIPAGTTIATNFDSDGNFVSFLTDAAIIVGAGANGPFDVAVTASIAGREGNVKASTIVRVIDQPTFDPTWSVTNPALAGGGQNEESDEDLRERARAFFSTLRRGTLAALEFGAKEVASVSVATATEDTATGIVTVRVTDADGNSTVQMVFDVEQELENWRCAGSLVNVIGGSAKIVDLGITLVVRAGFSTAARESDFVAAATARIAKLKVGETLFLDMLIAAIISVAPDDVFDVVFNTITVGGSPASIADVVPAAGEVLRPGTITVG